MRMHGGSSGGSVMDLFPVIADWVIDFVLYVSLNTEYVHLVIFFGFCMWLTGGLYGKWSR